MFIKINSYLKNNKGQVMVEFAIIAPIFFMIFFIGPFQIGLLMNYQMGISSAATEGARNASISLKTNISQIEDTGRNSAIDYIENVMKWDEIVRLPVTGTGFSGQQGCETSYNPQETGKVQEGDEIAVKCTYDVPLVIGLKGLSENGYIEMSYVSETIKEDF